MAKLGVCSWSLRPEDPGTLARRLHSLGLPRVQLALVPCVASSKWHGALDHLRSCGIEVLSGMLAMAGEDYSTLESIAMTGGVRSDAHWSENIDRAMMVADLAERCAVALVTFHAGFIPHDPNTRLREKMLDRLRTIADIFSMRGVAIALETGQESAATLLCALDELDRPGVGINLDPANMILYGMGDPVESARQLAGRIRQVHIKDARSSAVPGQWGSEVPVGLGEVPWARFLRVIEDARSDTNPIDMIVERESGSCRDEDIERARDLVRQLAPTIG